MSDKYDLAVLGAGPGGYVAAIRAGQLGMKIAIVERADVGGVCLNWGCIPTKALLRNAETIQFLSRNADKFGITFERSGDSWERAVSRSRQVVGRLTGGVSTLLQKNGAQLIRGSGRLAGANRVVIESGQGSEGTEVEAEHIIIATGSRARLLPGLQADGQRIITSRHAVQLEGAPERLLVMGGGAVGVEFAYIYNAYGSKVTIVEMLDRLLPLEDSEASALLQTAFRREGIDVLTGTRVESVNVGEAGVEVSVSSDGQSTERLDADRVLVAIGRAPNSEGLGLEEAGVEVDNGFVKVDEHLRTSVPSVYAIGDVARPPLLAHKAMHEAVQVVELIAGNRVRPLDPTFIPNCVYCVPQVASIGVTEEAALASGKQVKVSKFPFRAIGKALATGEHEGFVKIVSDSRYGEILGATIIGPEATELIHELVLARSAELTAEEIVATIHAHPTLSEAIHEAALGIDGVPLHI
jgi:dihydrolipoamide dehydrogenase